MQEIARREIKQIMASDKVMTNEKLRNMVFLAAFLKESQRMCPVVIQSIPRRTNKMVTLPTGQVLDKNVLVAVDTMASCYSEDIWRNPTTFDPWRFLDDRNNERLQPPDWYEYLSFGHGKRICLGMNYARTQIRVVLALLLQQYVISIPDDSPHKDNLQMTPVYSLPPETLHLVFKPIC